MPNPELPTTRTSHLLWTRRTASDDLICPATGPCDWVLARFMFLSGGLRFGGFWTTHVHYTVSGAGTVGRTFRVTGTRILLM